MPKPYSDPRLSSLNTPAQRRRHCPLCEVEHGERCPTTARIQQSERAAEKES
jgi:hypothetical protein